MALWVAQQLGIAPGFAPTELFDRMIPESLKLDGLLSVWQGPGVGDHLPAKGARE
jgi:hypothetical protein